MWLRINSSHLLFQLLYMVMSFGISLFFMSMFNGGFASSERQERPFGFYLVNDYQFVSEAEQSGKELCHLIRRNVFSGTVPILATSAGYVLVDGGCDVAGTPMHASMVRRGIALPDQPLTAEDVLRLQAAGQIDPAIDPEARLGLRNWGQGASGLLFVGFAILLYLGFVIAGQSAWADRRLHRAPRKSSQRAQGSLLATLCHVANLDGEPQLVEINMILSTMKRLTGQNLTVQQVAAMAYETDLRRDLSSLRDLGEDLTTPERDMVLEGAVTVAGAFGVIGPQQDRFLSDLAQALDFREEHLRFIKRQIVGGGTSAPSDEKWSTSRKLGA